LVLRSVGVWQGEKYNDKNSYLKTQPRETRKKVRESDPPTVLYPAPHPATKSHPRPSLKPTPSDGAAAKIRLTRYGCVG